MNHVIAYSNIPEDIRGVFDTLQKGGAIAVRASADGFWCIRLKPGTNAVALEGLLRGVGVPAFAGSATLLTLRAITTAEVALFDESDQSTLSRAIKTADAEQQAPVIQRIVDGLR